MVWAHGGQSWGLVDIPHLPSKSIVPFPTLLSAPGTLTSTSMDYSK